MAHLIQELARFYMKLLHGTPLKRFLRDYKRANRPQGRLTLVLQSVAYPSNVGAAFRLADAVGAEVVLTGITPQPPQPTIDKVSRNKHTTVRWRYVEDAVQALRALKSNGDQIVAVELAESAEPYHEFEYATNVCLVVGNEDHGVTRATLAACDAAVFLPMFGKGRSINVSMALGVVAYHVRSLG